jgi:hypothetical protein
MAYIIRGSSIDGTQWLLGIDCWTDSIGLAARFETSEPAELIASAMRLLNRNKDLDSIVGRITVLEKEEEYLNADLNRMLAEEDSWEH